LRSFSFLMPGTISLTGQDTIQVDSRVLADLADGDTVALTFPNDLGVAKSSKNGNVLFALNEQGRQCELSLRVLAGSADDKYLNSRMQEQINDISKFVMLTGVFAKRVGDGSGGLSSVIYQCTGGLFKRQPDAKSNAEGATDQSVMIYTIVFGRQNRSIQ